MKAVLFEVCLVLHYSLHVGGRTDTKPWSNVMEILDEKDGVDTELLVFAMTLINKVRKYDLAKQIHNIITPACSKSFNSVMFGFFICCLVDFLYTLY